jgi:hypothetical protein
MIYELLKITPCSDREGNKGWEYFDRFSEFAPTRQTFAIIRGS